MVEVGVDLYIFVKFGNNTEMGDYTLASASVSYVDPDNHQPLIGVVKLNKEINYNKENSLEYFEAIILHELIHILGFSNYYLEKIFNNFIVIKNNSYEIEKRYINSTKVLEVDKKYFNCNTLKGVESENIDEGGFGSHWEERILLGDIMNGVFYPEEQVISEFTLAFLEDTGFYNVNYFTGGLMQYGKNKGCDFLTSKCINNSNTNFKNEFFVNISYVHKYFDPGCSSGRQSRAYHSIYLYESIPQQYNYYLNNTWGGRASVNYCPVSEEYSEESKDIYYVGHCSKKGKGEYGSMIPYYESNDSIIYYKSGELNLTGEKHSNNSFCVLSSLISEKMQAEKNYSKTLHAVCYEIYCSNKSLTIKINKDYIVCPRGGGKIKVIEYNGYLLCPDYYLICSGTKLCNDMFDCVEKQSLLKSDIDYDDNYNYKTSQEINEDDNEITFSNEDAYELSTNGKCPQFCSQCNNLFQCIKCKKDYKIVEIVENGIIKRDCKLLDDLSNGYYEKEGIFYKYLNNCSNCTNNSICEECISGYILNNNSNKCFLIISNCEEYDEYDGKCSKCNSTFKIDSNGICKNISEHCEISNQTSLNCIKCDNNYELINGLCYKKINNCVNYSEDGLCDRCNSSFAFKENDRNNCTEKSLFEENYYTKDGGISYFKCYIEYENENENERIHKCKKCKYDNDKLACLQCEDGYIFKDNENNNCYETSEFINNSKYYKEDENHFNKCSFKIEHCDECENINGTINISCLKCENDYILKDDETNKCYKESEYNNNKYYKVNQYHINKCSFAINNCDECEKIDENIKCLKCENSFILKNEETGICYNYSEFNNSKFYFEDEYHIKQCSSSINNCDECEKIKGNVNCTKCNDSFFVVNDIRNYCSNNTPDQNTFYHDLQKDAYYSFEIYNLIPNCKTCNNLESCKTCKDNYAFINKDKSECRNIKDLGKKYFKDENDDTIYNKCSDYIENCDTCTSINECLTCLKNYYLTDDKKCINILEKKYFKDSDNLYYP